jgi:hypothetical protein
MAKGRRDWRAMEQVAERYWDRIRDSKNPYNFRLKIVMFYLKSRNYSLTAKAFKTSRQNVRKWVRRYLEGGLEGLKSRKRGPRISPRRTPNDSINAGVFAAYVYSKLSEGEDGQWL